MTPEECRLPLPQYLSGELAPAERRLFEEELAGSADLRIELEELRTVWNGLASLPEENPSPALRARFYQRLNAVDRSKQAGAPDRKFRLLAHAGLWLFIFAVGIYTGRARFDKRGQGAQLAKLNSQVQSLREIVAIDLLERQSATSRLEGVSWTSQVDKPNEELLNALLAALNRDLNVNVRLSSLNALERFAKNAQIRQALADSIQGQDSPLVQIALIDSLVQIRDRAAQPALKRLTADSAANPAVRQHARWGLQKLSYE